MSKKSNIIKFPGNPSTSHISHNEYDDEFDDFEAWEALVELREAEDYPGLVKYCKQRAERFPDDPYSQFYLGEAYVLNGEYEKAIEFLSEQHLKQPDNMDFQHVILDALFALGTFRDVRDIFDILDEQGHWPLLSQGRRTINEFAISPSYEVISCKIAGHPIYRAIMKDYNTTFRQTTSGWT